MGDAGHGVAGQGKAGQGVARKNKAPGRSFFTKSQPGGYQYLCVQLMVQVLAAGTARIKSKIHRGRKKVTGIFALPDRGSIGFGL